MHSVEDARHRRMLKRTVIRTGRVRTSEKEVGQDEDSASDKQDLLRREPVDILLERDLAAVFILAALRV
jgi:hypothetical protein